MNMKLTFRKKLFLPLIVSWLCLLAISGFELWQSKSRQLQERQLALKLATEVGLSTVKEFAALAAAGTLPLDEAKAQALSRLRAMRYGADGYFTIVDSHPKVLMHPIKPELQGKDMTQFQDKSGFHVYRAVADIARSSGEGWIEYVWPKPGATDQKPYPKGAYIFTYKPWDWTFITGLYLDDLTAAFVRELWEVGAMLLVVLVMLTAIVLTVIRSIEKTIGGDPAAAAEVARRIAAGDLTAQVSTAQTDGTSLMFAMKTMRDSLLEIVREVRSGTDAIRNASGEIAAGNHDLSARTEQQASALEETASSMEELTSTVKQNEDNARQANTLAVAAATVAEKGGNVIHNVVTTMDGINESAQQIADIISVIDGIAFQTNILALNAAVEAARAGEQGRGFAVVASEVRVLAQRSAAAAKEIKNLIDTSCERVSTGSRLVNEAGATMQEIVGSVELVTAIMADITAASREQTAGIEQINQAISQMDEATQQNAALVEEAAAASQAMQQQAANLSSIVSVFKIADAPVGAAPPPVEASSLVPKPTRLTRIGLRGQGGRLSSPALGGAASASGNGGWEGF